MASFGVAVLLAARPATAATITVTTTAEFSADACTLRDAIVAANLDAPFGACAAGSGEDVIHVPAGTYTLTQPAVDIEGDLTGLPIIVSPIVIEGDGQAQTIIERHPDAPRFRLLQVLGIFDNLPGSLELRQLTLRGGSAVDNRPGGAVYTQDRPVILRHVTVDGNSAQFGGGLGDLGFFGTNGGQFTIEDSTFTGNRAANGGGAVNVSPGGTLVVRRSVFADNVADETGGALHSRGDGTVIDVEDSEFVRNRVPGQVGGALAGWRVRVVRGIFRDNTARQAGGAIYTYARELDVQDSAFVANAADRGGAVAAISRLTVTGTTFAGNRANSDRGGALFLESTAGPHRIANSTFSGNRSVRRGGAIALAGGNVTVNNVTVTGNASDEGYGHGVALGWNGESALSMANSIVARNTGADGFEIDVHWDDSEQVASLGHNVIGSSAGTRGAFAAAGDIVGTPEAPIDPGLLPLADNGGPTETHALAPDSLALDAGTPAGVGTPCEATDQRGRPRPGGGGRCDVGAYEQVLLYDLTVSAVGGGVIYGATASPCAGTCTTSFEPGAEVELSYSAPFPLQFLGWSGACSGLSSVCRVTMNAAKSVTATFGVPPPTNGLPIVTNPGDRRNTDADVIRLQIAAWDPEGDALGFTATNLPASLSIDAGTGLIEGPLEKVASDQTYYVTVRVTDVRGGEAFVSFTWVIAHAVPAPRVIDIVESIVVSDAPSMLFAQMVRITEAIVVSDRVVPLPARLVRVEERIGVGDGLGLVMPNTRAGSNVTTTPAAGVTVRFASVTQSGNTQATPAPVPAPPAGFTSATPAIEWDIQTSALFEGAVTVCFDYPATAVAPPALMHFEDGRWVNRTTSFDEATGVVCGVVSSLSPFAVFVPIGIEGRMTGAGAIDAAKRERFEFRVAERALGAERGRVEFTRKTPKSAGANERTDRFESTSFEELVFLDDPGFRSGRRPLPAADWAAFIARGTWNGMGGYTFEGRATDRGEPGRGRDSFEYTVRDPLGAVVVSGGGLLSDGNIQSQRLSQKR